MRQAASSVFVPRGIYGAWNLSITRVMWEDECMGGGKRAVKQNGDLVLMVSTSWNTSKRQNSKEGPTESESLFTKIYFALTVSIDGHCVHYILCEKCQTKSLASCSALPPRTSNVSVYSTESGLDDTLVRCPTKHDKNIPWLNRGTCNQLYDGAFKFAQTPTTGREARQWGAHGHVWWFGKTKGQRESGQIAHPHTLVSMYGCGIATDNVLISALSECKGYHLRIPLVENKGLCVDHSDFYRIISMSRHQGSNDHLVPNIKYN